MKLIWGLNDSTNYRTELMITDFHTGHYRLFLKPRLIHRIMQIVRFLIMAL